MTAAFARNPLALACAAFLLLLVAACALAPLLGLPDPSATDLGAVREGPSGAHLLGTDAVGRDVLSRLLHGGATTLLAAAVGTVVAIAIGLPLGLAAGYLGGPVDSAATWIGDLVQALPGVLALLAVAAVLGPNPIGIMAVFGLLLLPAMMRPVRAVALDVRRQPYIDAAKVSGLRDARIVARHVAPVALPTALVQAGFVFGIAIIAQAGLEVIGVGEAGAPSWGGMLSDAFAESADTPWLLIVPAVTITLTVLCAVLVSTGVRDSLEGHEGRVRRARPPGRDGVEAGSEPADLESGVLLAVRDLDVSYETREGPQRVVTGVSYDARVGEVLGIVGESGSGKTQTLLAVLGLLAANGQVTGGAAWYRGSDLAALPTARLDEIRGRRIGYVPQDPMSNLDPSFRVGSQIVEPMRVHLGLSRRRAKARAIELLGRVGIADPEWTFDAFPHQISGGMAQRVLIAAAISCDPELLLADEPTTALDVTVQAEVLDVFRSLVRERNLGVVLVTHDFGVVADICDQVAVMREGRIVERQPVKALFDSPSHPYTRALLAADPRGLERRRPTREPDSAPLLQIERLTVKYPGQGFRAKDKTVVKDVSLTLGAGETLGLVGESGSGKTTLGRAILGLAPVTSGDVVFDGRSIAHLDRAERRALSDEIQVVFQDPYGSLNPALDVEDILTEPLLRHGRSAADARARVRELLEAVHLPRDIGSRRARELSGGQRQRIAIARALCRSPRLIVCDEAVSALDLSTQATVLELLSEIQAMTGVAYLFISHDLDVVRYIGDRTAVIHDGEIVEVGDSETLASSPSHPYSQRLLASAPVADPRQQAERRDRRAALARPPQAAEGARS